MRGRRSDPEFIANFIQNCVGENKVTSEQILNEANLKIKEIDSEIIRVELLKKQRSKILDVIEMFSKKIMTSSDKSALDFYLLSNIKKAYELVIKCDFDKSNACLLKELQNINVLRRENNQLIHGARFREFVDFYKKNYEKKCI